MSPKQTREEIRTIPIDKIDVLNPRDRNTKAFKVIVGNIKDIGLKKPIKVTPRTTDDGEQRYVLVFGEGRLTAFRNLGEKKIPAIVVEISDEDAFLMSLVENIARRQEKPLENLASITALRAKGHSPKEIATKIGMTPHYVQGMLTLLEEGEERLVVAVERGQIPLNVALTIHGAGNDDKSLQAALQDAYESGKLRGKPLMDVRRILDKRRTLGRSANKQGPRKRAEVSADAPAASSRTSTPSKLRRPDSGSRSRIATSAPSKRSTATSRYSSWARARTSASLAIDRLPAASLVGVIARLCRVTMRDRLATSAVKAPMSWKRPVTRRLMGSTA